MDRPSIDRLDHILPPDGSAGKCPTPPITSIHPACHGFRARIEEMYGDLGDGLTISSFAELYVDRLVLHHGCIEGTT